MNFDSVWTHWRFLGTALAATIEISFASLLLALALGTAIAVLRVFGGRALAGSLAFFVDTIRSIPALVIIIYAYFALPLIAGITVGSFTTAVGALGVHLSAYVAETVRGGLLSVRMGQMLAARSIGMTTAQALRYVLLPQAIIRMLPNLGSLASFAVKDSALASVIAVPELVRQSQVLVGMTYRPFETYSTILVLFFLICYPLTRGVDRLYRHLAPRGAS